MLPNFTVGSLQSYAAVAMPQVFSVIIIILITIIITFITITREYFSLWTLFTRIFEHLISDDDPKFIGNSHQHLPSVLDRWANYCCCLCHWHFLFLPPLNFQTKNLVKILISFSEAVFYNADINFMMIQIYQMTWWHNFSDNNSAYRGDWNTQHCNVTGCYINWFRKRCNQEKWNHIYY